MKIEHGVVTEITNSDVHDDRLIFPEEASSIAADISDLLNSRASEKIKHIDFQNVQSLESLRLSNLGLWEPVTLYKIAPHAITVRMPKIECIAKNFALKMGSLEDVYAPCVKFLPEFAFAQCPKLRLFSTSHILQKIAPSSFFKSSNVSRFIGVVANVESIWIESGKTYCVENRENVRHFICVRDNNSDYSAEFIQEIDLDNPQTKIYVLKDGGYFSSEGKYYPTTRDIII